MNEAELSELLTAPGFFRFLAQQAKLAAEEVKRIYLLGRPWGLWPPDLDLNREAAETGIDVYTYLAALQPLLDMDTTQKEAHWLSTRPRCLAGRPRSRSQLFVRTWRRWPLYRERTRKPFAAYSMRCTPIASVSASCPYRRSASCRNTRSSRIRRPPSRNFNAPLSRRVSNANRADPFKRCQA